MYRFSTESFFFHMLRVIGLDANYHNTTPEKDAKRQPAHRYIRTHVPKDIHASSNESQLALGQLKRRQGAV